MADGRKRRKLESFFGFSYDPWLGEYFPSTVSAKTTTVATKILLDDANNGFKNGNFVCSPFSLEVVLGMLAAGAQGKTLKQLLGFLGHETIEQLLYESPCSKLFNQILSNPNGGGGGLYISLANGIWVDKKLNRVAFRYQEVLRTVYKTKASFVNFADMPDQAAKEINSWAKETTKGLIPTIVDSSQLSRGVVIMLANALYFKGMWSDPFDANKTMDKDFHLINGQKVSVPFITSRKSFDFGSFEDYKILKIPYESKRQSNKFSIYIFLPDRKDGLQDLLQVFHSDHTLFHKRFDLDSRNLKKLWIPKFKISCDFEAHDVMNQLGLTLPFKPMNKEFSGILGPKCPYGHMLSDSKILQICVIKVDEKGTEAAAVTRMGCPGCPARKPTPPATFVADHPFMFMIREEASLAVFFMGVVLDPHVN